ncbi:hypothetical protein IHE45_17G063700 [Dioscorea alata]|uniref:Uncharacterized protein n=1 Tax=Dioscorea alata TaxID=55571 RepID=A0ACB7UCT0_DIOAL|nr:hypothetical protein IHE45_17G063700 [Dioscorea alata]
METPPVEELLKKIQELEVGQAKLKQDVLRLIPGADERRADWPRSHSISPQRTPPRKSSNVLASFSSRLQRESKEPSSKDGDVPPGAGFSDRQYLNILPSLGQSVYIFDLDGRIIYW